MITKDDVRRGFDHGAVIFKNAKSLYGMDEVACCIGHKGWNFNWFYFGGQDAENTTPSRFIESVGLDNVMCMVANTLNDCIREIDEEEYAFYEAVLAECRKEE